MSNDDLFAPIEQPAEAAAGGVVLCEFDGLAIAIPQQDVLTIEHGSQLAAPLGGERVIGWFESDRGPWPVYALDRMLQLVDDSQLQRAFLVFLKTDPLPIGLLCESVRIIGDLSELKVQSLPYPLRNHAPADTGIAPLPDNRIALTFAPGLFAPYLRKLDDSANATSDATVLHDVRAWRHALQSESATLAIESSAKKIESVRAWFLDWPSQPLALALCEVIEVVDEPHIHLLPFGPHWCHAVLQWRDQFLALAGEHATPGIKAHLVVTAFQTRDGEPLQYAAFAIDGTPRQITVTDGLDCEAPHGVFGVAQLRASFQFENRTVVVPELAALFAGGAARA